MKEQKPENKADDENDKRLPEANCACTLETCGEDRIERETCVDISKQKELHDEDISPERLSEMINKEINDSIRRINNSIKNAVQTLVTQCSMVPRMQVSMNQKFLYFSCIILSIYFSIYFYVKVK
ncbi:hypothetical protein P5V15_006679 [Pogonomyrmex californicus]